MEKGALLWMGGKSSKGSERIYAPFQLFGGYSDIRTGETRYGTSTPHDRSLVAIFIRCTVHSSATDHSHHHPCQPNHGTQPHNPVLPEKGNLSIRTPTIHQYIHTKDNNVYNDNSTRTICDYDEQQSLVPMGGETVL